MSVPTLEAMDVNEIDDIPFGPFDLRGGETIADFNVVVVVAGGTDDPDPGALRIGPPQIGQLERNVWTETAEGRFGMQRLGARQAGTTYGLKGIANLSSGRVLVASALLPVKNLASTLDSCG